MSEAAENGPAATDMAGGGHDAVDERVFAYAGEADLYADEAADEGDAAEAFACFDGDQGDLPPAARYACTELLKKYSISEAVDGALYQTTLDNLEGVERCLNNLYLRLKVSKRYKVVYATSVSDDELISGAQRMTVKRNVALKRDETVLLIRLRVLQHKLEAEDPDLWFVERRDMEEHLESTCYRDDLDEERVASRISNAIKTLCTLGYLKLVNAEEQRYRIMPQLPATLDLERALALADQLRAGLAQDPEPEGFGAERADAPEARALRDGQGV